MCIDTIVKRWQSGKIIHEHAINGVATGTTDPVPSCFKKIQRADAVAVTQI